MLKHKGTQGIFDTVGSAKQLQLLSLLGFPDQALLSINIAFFVNLSNMMSNAT